MHLPTLLFLVPLLSAAVVAQTAGTSAPLICAPQVFFSCPRSPRAEACDPADTYAGNSVAPSLLSAIETAGAPASALNAASGMDTATGLVPAMATTATAEPATIPSESSDQVLVDFQES